MPEHNLLKSIKGSLQQNSTPNTNSTELLEMGPSQKIRDQSDSSDRIAITVDHNRRPRAPRHARELAQATVPGRGLVLSGSRCAAGRGGRHRKSYCRDLGL